MEVVNLKTRNITFIPQSLIQDISSFVKYLYLDNNSIRTLPDELFLDCKNLMWLDLRCNRVRTLPDAIKGHQNLQVLLLGKNDVKRLPWTLGSLPKLRELQVIGNPLDYPTRDIVKKGSKYLIRFLQDKWNCNKSNDDTVKLLNFGENTVKKIDLKNHKNDKTDYKSVNTIKTAKIQLMERYSWPMIFLTNWSSDRLVTNRVIRMKELERIYWEKQKIILEKRERILQSYKNKETLKEWRNKAKQLQFIENSHKLNRYQGLQIPYGVDKEFTKMVSRQIYQKESLENINKIIVKPTAIKPQFNFDLEMSDIYNMLVSLTPDDVKNTNIKTNVLTTSNIDLQIQKLHEIQKRIVCLKTNMI